MAKKESILSLAADASPSGLGESKKQDKFCKKILFTVDGGVSAATLLTPPEAGLPGRKTRELVLAYFGTANWNSILSRFYPP
jgi:hypothetical protein